MNKVFVAALVGCSVLATAAVAADHPRRVVVKETVRTDDLDLQTDAGAQQMFRRIKGAAGSACYQPHSEVTPRVSYEIARCRREAVGRAVAELDAPLVTATYETWTNAPPRHLASR